MATFSTWLACCFSYPWGVTVKEMVDLWPKVMINFGNLK